MSNLVPDGWCELKLKDISSLITKGTTPKKYTNHGVNFVKVESVTKSSELIPSKFAHIDISTHESLKRSQLHDGDILFSIAGSLGRLAVINSNHLPANTNQAFAIIRLIKDAIDTTFCAQQLKGEAVQLELKNLQTVGAQPNLSLQQVSDILLKTPPLPEQQKIAKILTSVDEVIEKTQAQIDKLKDLKTGMMQELLTNGIGHTEFKDSPIGRIPAEWEVQQMRDVCSTRQGLQIPISKRFTTPAENRYVYLTIKYINTGFDKSVAEYIENPSERVSCDESDIILARTGATGKVVTGVEGVFHNNFFMVDYSRQKLNKNYLVHYLNSPFIQIEIKNRAGTTTIPDLNHGDFYSLPIVIPNFDEQREIAKALDAVGNLIETKLRKLDSLKANKKALMQDLLTGKVRVNA